MAKQKSQGVMTTAFYLLICLMAMHFLALSIAVGGQYYRGIIGVEDLKDMMSVLAGSQKYSMSIKDIQDYKNLKQDLADREARDQELKGDSATREKSAAALANLQKVQEEKAAALKTMIEEERQKLESLRATVERTAAEAQKESQRLEDLRLQRQKTEQSEQQAKLKKTIASMDAGNLAQFLQMHMDQLGAEGPAEASRLLKEYVSAGMTAETLAEMTPDYVRQILPLLENEFADWDPQRVSNEWTRVNGEYYQSPAGIAQHLQKLSVPRALKILMLLPADIRAQVVQILQK